MVHLLNDIFKMQQVRGVLLDLDNTIYYYDYCHNKALQACHFIIYKEKKILYEDFLVLYKEAQKHVKERTKGQGSSHSRFLYFQFLIEKLFGRTHCSLTTILEEEYWKVFIESMKLDVWVLPFLDECRKNSILVCILTDLTSAVQFRKIQALGLENRIDFVVTSEEAGVEKPNAKIFDYALEKMKLTPRDVVMIGDDLVKDIDGAENHNIRAYRVQR